MKLNEEQKISLESLYSHLNQEKEYLRHRKENTKWFYILSAVMVNWGEIERIIQLNKLPRHCYHHYCCYVLAYAHAFNFKQKQERFHKQLQYGVFWSHNPKAYEELKDYLINLKREDWLYKWPDTESSYNPKTKLNS